MTLPSAERCDAGLSDGTRCRNRAECWITPTVQPKAEVVEVWPMAVCELHHRNGPVTRLGPDRRSEYAAYKAAKGETFEPVILLAAAS
jgi:hypothetical protein